MKPYILWLDDVRNPFEKYYYKMINPSLSHEILWAKTSTEFLQYWNQHKTEINTIWFDHDLGEETNGYDCFKKIEKDILDSLDTNKPLELPYIFSQSANPEGKRNILTRAENLRRHLESTKS